MTRPCNATPFFSSHDRASVLRGGERRQPALPLPCDRPLSWLEYENMRTWPEDADLPPFSDIGVERCEQLWRGRQRHTAGTGSQDLVHLGETRLVEMFESRTNRYESSKGYVGHDQSYPVIRESQRLSVPLLGGLNVLRLAYLEVRPTQYDDPNRSPHLRPELDTIHPQTAWTRS
jgi:hypothetical protein